MTDTAPTISPSEQMLNAIRERAKEDMYFFAKFVLGYKDLVPHVHGKLCLQLEDGAIKGHRVTLPRGFFKSTIVSIAYPMWRVIRDPNTRILLTQNTITNAAKRLSSIDSHFKINQLFRQLFPELIPDKTCRWSNETMTVKRPGVFDEGTFEAAGTRTKKVSNHYDVIIEDDTVTPDLDDMTATNVTPSPEDIEQAIGYHAQIMPLFQNPSEGINIVVGTRWAQRDLLAWITDKQPDYQPFVMAVIDDANKPTFPERFPLATIEKIKNAMGTYLFSCNYLNTPMRSDDMPFRLEWFGYYEYEPANLLVYMTIDPSGDPEMKKRGLPDYNAIVVTGKDQKSGLIYVLDYWRKQCNPGVAIDAIFTMQERWKPLKVSPEAIAYQNTLIYHLRERMRADNSHFVIDPIPNSNRSKAAKIMGLQPIVSNRTLLFRRQHRELISELEAFPYGANDDLADALQMHLSLWQLTSGTKEMAPSTDGLYRFEDAYRELQDRNHRVRGGLVMDILEPEFAGLN